MTIKKGVRDHRAAKIQAEGNVGAHSQILGAQISSRAERVKTRGSRRVRVGVDPERDQEGSNSMTSNIQNGAPPGRRELDRDRDSGRGSEAPGAGGGLNAATLMSDVISQASWFGRDRSRSRCESG
jgi:hypothetical protein